MEPPRQFWFVVRLRALVAALLYDEAATQRMCGAALLGLGQLIQSGGVIPGTEMVVPGFAGLSQFGSLVQMAAVYLVAGGRLPSAATVKKGDT